MSTRGLTGFRLNDKLYAMYNHFDSYPEYLGQRVLEFCKRVDWTDPVIKKRVEKVNLVQEEDKPSNKKILKYAKYANLSVGGTHTLDELDWYSLLRGLQGVEILNQVIRGKVKHMTDDEDFLINELFCEWAYIVNLDDYTLEVWHKAKNLYNYNLFSLPKFMLGVRNEFKRSYVAPLDKPVNL